MERRLGGRWRQQRGWPYAYDDPRWIADTLMPTISVADAEFALKVLRDLGMLVPDERTGKLVQRDELVETGTGPLSQHVVRFHLSMMEIAAVALDHIPRAEREFSALTLCLSEEQMVEMKSELVRTMASVLQRFRRDGRASRVVQVNVQMFPLTRQLTESKL